MIHRRALAPAAQGLVRPAPELARAWRCRICRDQILARVMVRPHRVTLLLGLLTAVFLAFASISLSACDLLPKTGTEWTIALVIAGVLVVGVIVMAWYTSRNSKK
ncbi:MAG: LPXTG cell wall anchor domain-containing protein [Deltaproteobacteria bacterium]|jgi:LPXTG-motif cell wall-anchored protein|nr:LPXTG cell wall anchor domain-containing protein [Deltaproteobacteria bacterium]